ANIFVGYQEHRLFSVIDRPATYFRYVDDTFTIFDSKTGYVEFLNRLNDLHPALKFTFETEENDILPFLDVLVSKNLDSKKYLTTVYRKPTFTGNYVRYESFCHKSRKISLISTLTHRAQMICSPDNLKSELEYIEKTFADNGYPEQLVGKVMSKHLSTKEPTFGPNRCPIWLKLPYIGRAGDIFEKQIKSCVSKCFNATMLKVLFSSRPNFKGLHKDRLPTHASSNVIYKFSCYCGSSYVGKTTQTLRKRSKQHVPACVLAFRKAVCEGNLSDFEGTKKFQSVKNAITSSSITKHLFENLECLKNFDFDKFCVIARGRNKFHLDVLESVFISTFKPEICKQLEFCYKILLF
ncbi:MAG: hypothetical protein VXY56_13425, partial [Pseudomonadota bacterium]|nr:hypothetical protein [Pseudomonadota bacterium]